MKEIEQRAEELAKKTYRDNPTDLENVDYKYNTDINAPRKRKAFVKGYIAGATEDKWISVKDRLPTIIKDGYSEEVLCVGYKSTNKESVRYEIMSWMELSESQQTTLNYKWEKIKYGWSNRWWDTNPDLYEITHWTPLSEPLK